MCIRDSRRYCPNTPTNSVLHNSNYNNPQSPEIRTMEAPRNQINDQQTVNETADQSNSLTNSSQQPLNYKGQ